MPLRLPILASLNLLLLGAVVARAQTAEDFFNSGAQLYISNNIPSALEKTENGLKIFPNDEKLQKLEKLLKQQQQSQSQQNQQQQQNQSQQNQSQKQNQQNQSQQQQQQNQEEQNQAKQNEQKKSEQQQSQEKSGDEKSEQANAMTPQEAKQLLDSQKENEQFLSMKPKEKLQNENQPVKNW